MGNWSTSHTADSKEVKFLEALTYLHQHVEELTQCQGTDNPSIIDLILIGKENQITNLKYESPLGKSDHSVLIFKLKCYAEPKSKSKRFIYNKGNFDTMKQHLESINWSNNFV